MDTVLRKERHVRGFIGSVQCTSPMEQHPLSDNSQLPHHSACHLLQPLNFSSAPQPKVYLPREALQSRVLLLVFFMFVDIMTLIFYNKCMKALWIGRPTFMEGKPPTSCRLDCAKSRPSHPLSVRRPKWAQKADRYHSICLYEKRRSETQS